MGLVRTSAPAAAVLTTAEAKTQARIDFSTDDTYVDELVSRATTYLENYTNCQFVDATYQWTLDRWETCFYVPRPPLASITSIAYLDSNGDSQTLATSVYRVDAKAFPGRITEAYLQSWPTLYPVTNAITITYQAGYADAASVPDDIKHAVAMLVSHWYENRDAVLVGTASKALEYSLESLLQRYMREQYG